MERGRARGRGGRGRGRGRGSGGSARGGRGRGSFRGRGRGWRRGGGGQDRRPAQPQHTCGVCRQQPSKYRCPKCQLRYCSLDCYKTHREGNACADAALETAQRQAAAEQQKSRRRLRVVAAAAVALRTGQLPDVGFETTAASGEPAPKVGRDDQLDSPLDVVPPERLQKLGESEAVRGALRNPHLVDLLLDVRESQDPVAALRAAMRIPVFVEFADACLAVVGDEARERG